MISSKGISGILNSVIESIKLILPNEVSFRNPSLIGQPFTQNEITSLIAFHGDIEGRIMIDSDFETIGNIAKNMYGMALEGEMLESFTGEFSNMIAGNLATILTKHKLELDITPPTIFVGSSKIYGFKKAFRLPADIENAGELMIIVMHE